MYNIESEFYLDKNPMVGGLGHQAVLAEAQWMLKMLDLFNLRDGQDEPMGDEFADINYKKKTV